MTHRWLRGWRIMDEPPASTRQGHARLRRRPRSETPPLPEPSALAAGTRLGPYLIVAPIGAGGMGEVYCARDTRLGREVAIKTLPPGMADDSDRRARFECEGFAVIQARRLHELVQVEPVQEASRFFTRD